MPGFGVSSLGWPQRLYRIERTVGSLRVVGRWPPAWWSRGSAGWLGQADRRSCSSFAHVLATPREQRVPFDAMGMAVRVPHSSVMTRPAHRHVGVGETPSLEWRLRLARAAASRPKAVSPRPARAAGRCAGTLLIKDDDAERSLDDDPALGPRLGAPTLGGESCFRFTMRGSPRSWLRPPADDQSYRRRTVHGPTSAAAASAPPAAAPRKPGAVAVPCCRTRCGTVKTPWCGVPSLSRSGCSSTP